MRRRPDELDVTRRADDPAGPFDLALLCDRGFADGTRSAACFFGCSGMFLDQDMLYTLTYSGDLLLQVMRCAGQRRRRSGHSRRARPRARR